MDILNPICLVCEKISNAFQKVGWSVTELVGWKVTDKINSGSIKNINKPKDKSDNEKNI